MQILVSALHFLLQPTAIIQTFGLIGILVLIFAESGVLIGLFLPGDSLLFTAGFLASQGYLSMPLLVIGAWIAAVLGDNFGYMFGSKLGPRLFSKKESFFFKKEYIDKSEEYFAKYGNKTIIISRFTPIIRTFAPILAGVGSMKYKTFMKYNLIGGLLWTAVISSLGYFLGRVVPDIDRYILPVVGLIVIASVVPPIVAYMRSRKEAKKA